MPISPKAAGLLLVGCLICEGGLLGQVRSGGGRGGFGGFSRGGSRAGGVSRAGGGVGRMSTGRPALAGGARATGSASRARGLPSVQRTPRRAQSRVIQPSAPAVPEHGPAAHPGNPRRGATVGAVPGFPGTDQVLTPRRSRGRSHGNVIAPGTPGRIGHGNVITPGTPHRSGTSFRARGAASHGVRSKMLTYGQDFGHGHRFIGVPVVYVPYGYVRYGYGGDYEPQDYEEESPYIYRVDPETATESGTDYVIRVESGEERAPAESKVYEVRPAEEEPAVEPQIEPDSASTQEPPPGAEPILYLIAIQNGNIYTSTEHWIESDALHYITRGGAHNLVSIEDVDMELTARLNRERGLAFIIEVREALP